LDLNHIFLFIAVVSPLAVLARAWRPGGAYRGWRIASFVVLAVTGMAWLFFREQAGFIGSGVWFALLFLPAIGLRRVAELAARHRYRAARRIATALQFLHPSDELRRQVHLLRILESGEKTGVPPTPTAASIQDRRPRVRDAPAVLAFIFLNVVAFLVEISYGDLTEPLTLHRLGALEPYFVISQGEYWRLVTALFLHGGAVHLLFNLFALYVLGPPLERSIGSARFCACYLISGIGSSAGVVLLALVGLINATQLVGASGSIMGIVGAWAGFLLRHRHIPLAKQRLNNILLIVLIQIAFDLSTPQVSMAAHMCGLFTGFVVGLILSREVRAIDLDRPDGSVRSP
jgi:membrane associated rhomboid family serine protease